MSVINIPHFADLTKSSLRRTRQLALTLQKVLEGGGGREWMWSGKSECSLELRLKFVKTETGIMVLDSMS